MKHDCFLYFSLKIAMISIIETFVRELVFVPVRPKWSKKRRLHKINEYLIEVIYNVAGAENRLVQRSLIKYQHYCAI